MIEVRDNEIQNKIKISNHKITYRKEFAFLVASGDFLTRQGKMC